MPIVRLPQGELRDEIRQPLYDTLQFDGGVSPVGTRRFFASVAGKDLSETNLTQDSILDTAKSFRVQGLALDAQNFRLDNALVIPLILEHSSIELVIGEKQYWQGPGRLACGRMWQNAATTVADTSVLLQQYGWGAIQPVVLQGRHVIDINPLQKFFASFAITNLTAAEIVEATPADETQVPFVFSLKGLLRRPVQ